MLTWKNWKHRCSLQTIVQNVCVNRIKPFWFPSSVLHSTVMSTAHVIRSGWEKSISWMLESTQAVLVCSVCSCQWESQTCGFTYEPPPSLPPSPSCLSPHLFSAPSCQQASFFISLNKLMSFLLLFPPSLSLIDTRSSWETCDLCHRHASSMTHRAVHYIGHWQSQTLCII